MTTEKHCKLQRGCHTFAIFFRNLQRPRWKLFTTLSPPAWNLLQAKDGLCLPNFHKIALQVAVDMSHAATCLAKRCEKLRIFLLFLQLATQHFVAVAGCKTGVLHVNSFLQLVSQRLLRDKLQEKLPRVTWPLVPIISLNWSTVKRSILIGSLSDINFAIRTAQMDCSRTDFVDLCFWKDIRKKTFWR